MVMQRFTIPTTGNVPIYYARPVSPLGYATVDNVFLALVEHIGPWYLGDLRESTSPRISLRPPGHGKKILTLNRVIVSVSRFMREKNLKIVPILSKEDAWELSKNLAPVKFEDRNHFNCTLNNLLIGFRPASSEVPLNTLVVPRIDGAGEASDDFDLLFSSGATDPLAAASLRNEFEELLDNPSRGVAAKGSQEISDLMKLLSEDKDDGTDIVKPLE